MITPTFKVDQDDNFVYITINTPHVRVLCVYTLDYLKTNTKKKAQDVDLYVEGSEFRFYLRPYFLR